MRVSSFVSLVAVASIMISGCKQPPVQRAVKVTKKKVEKKQEDSFDRKFDKSLDEFLKTKGNFIEITGEKNYKVGDSISFTVDTKGQKGYLYIITVDRDRVTFLQPNQYSPLHQIRGKRTFPDDFTNGVFGVQAVKYCKDECEEEKTTIYALLTEEPIRDIKTIKSGTLLDFYKNSSMDIRVRGALIMPLKNANSTKSGAGKMEFWVR